MGQGTWITSCPPTIRLPTQITFRASPHPIGTQDTGSGQERKIRRGTSTICPVLQKLSSSPPTLPRPQGASAGQGARCTRPKERIRNSIFQFQPLQADLSSLATATTALDFIHLILIRTEKPCNNPLPAAPAAFLFHTLTSTFLPRPGRISAHLSPPQFQKKNERSATFFNRSLRAVTRCSARFRRYPGDFRQYWRSRVSPSIHQPSI